MSTRTDVVVLTGPDEEEAFLELQRKHRLSFFRALGTEGICRVVWTGSLNVTFEAARQFLSGARWKRRDLVEILHVKETPHSILVELYPPQGRRGSNVP